MFTGSIAIDAKDQFTVTYIIQLIIYIWFCFIFLQSNVNNGIHRANIVYLNSFLIPYNLCRFYYRDAFDQSFNSLASSLAKHKRLYGLFFFYPLLLTATVGASLPPPSSSTLCRVCITRAKCRIIKEESRGKRISKSKLESIFLLLFILFQNKNFC